MKVRVTKQWIIDAITAACATGKLNPGTWITANFGHGARNFRYKNVERNMADAVLMSCEACAVGNLFLAAVAEPLDGWVDDPLDEQAERRVVRAVDDWISVVVGKECYDYDRSEPGAEKLAYPASTTQLDTLDYALSKKHYLQALSCAFEGTYAARYSAHDHESSVAVAAQATCAMVQERFPEYIILDLNGFTPQPGLEIVNE